MINQFNVHMERRMIDKLTLMTLILIVSSGILSAKDYNVKDYGAVGDGKIIDSPAINKLLQQVASEGGGTIVFPSGVYLCYSIHLQSNITIQLEEDAVIKAAPVTTTAGYDAAEPNTSNYQDFGHSHWHNSLLWGDSLQHLTIEGKGLIDGSGVLTRGGERPTANGMWVANKALALRDCRYVTIRGVSFRECGHFALLLTGVDDLLIEDVVADTNRDGFDIDCCERVKIRRCRVNTMNDDAIVLKCSYALGWAKQTSKVIIEDCHVSGYDVGSLLDGTFTTKSVKAPDGDGPTGRIKLGTESNGGFTDITIRNCKFTHCRGLALETVDGAPLKDIRVSDLEMEDICNSPIYIRLGDRMRAPKGFRSSVVNNISIRDVHVVDADSRYACLIAGVEGHPVRNVSIKNLYIKFRGGLTLEDVKEQRGSNPFFFREIRRGNTHGENNYPEPSAHGIQPAWGFSISYAEDIRLKNIQLETIQPDERPMFHLENTKNISIPKNLQGL